MMICQFSNPSPFPRHRLRRWGQVQIPVSLPKQVSIIPEGETEKIQLHTSLFEIDDASFLAVYRQSHSPFNEAFDVLSQSRRLVSRQHDEVVGIAYQFRFCPFRRPICEVDIKPVQKDVGQQWRNSSALWRPLTVFPSSALLVRFYYLRFEPHPNQLDHTAISDPVAHASQQLVVFNGIEVAFQVGIVDGLIAVLQMPANLRQCVVRATSGAEAITPIQKVRFKDRFQNHQRGLLYNAVSHTRYSQWPEFPVRFGDVDSPHWSRQVAMLLQFAFDLIEKRPLAFRARCDVIDFDAIHACCALVGLYTRQCSFQHVDPIDAVIQRIEPKLLLLLRLLAQFLSQLRNFLRHPAFFHPVYRFFRSRIKVQAVFPLLTVNNVSSQAPSLHGCYPLPRYYEPVRLPNVAARAVIDSRPALMTPLSGDENSISSSRPWVSQVPRLIFARALSPLTPEGSPGAFARCFPDDARLRLIRQRGRLHLRNEARTSSLALRLARSPCEASHVPLLDTHARLATCQ